MIYLVDTNVLLRFVDRTHPLHNTIRVSIRCLRQQGHTLKVAPQNCIEFWNVATRPIERNGFGLTPVEADRLLHRIERLFPLLLDSPEIYSEWRALVVKFGVSGVQVHDARLVGAMKANKISHILTFNTSDFIRYKNEGITAVDPATLQD